jgi:cysteine rich repeat protein
MITSSTTLWTTFRDFAAVVALCIAGAIALFAMVDQAHAGGSPPPAYEYDHNDYGERYPPSRREAWAACAPDVRRYCPNVLPGGGRILSCLGGNKDRLSHRCRDTLVRAWAYYRR